MKEKLGKGHDEDIPMIQSLLKYYEDIFATPKELPSKRVIDH